MANHYVTMMSVSEHFCATQLGLKNVDLHSSLNDIYLLLVHPFM